MPDANLEKLTLKNFVTATRGAVGSQLFQHLYVKDKQTNQEIDVIKGGKLSCAYVVSSLLTLFGLIDRPHATVSTTLQKMQEAGWQKVGSAAIGAIAYWPVHEGNEHIAIVVDEDACVSNSTKAKTPVLHSLTLSSGLEPTAFYVHPTLKQ